MRLDDQAPEPSSRQIADRIRIAIAAGTHRPGEAIPSIRTLAAELGVNPNTVRRAYRTLEDEGLLRSQWGRGMFVTRRGDEAARTAAEIEVAALFERAWALGTEAGLARARIDALAAKARDRAGGGTRPARPHPARGRGSRGRSA